MDEIVNLILMKGSNYGKVQEFYEKLSKNFDALQTLVEVDRLQGFVMSTLNKLPPQKIKPDLVRVEQNWEDWSIEKLIDALQKWVRRNNMDGNTDHSRRLEKHLFTQMTEEQTSHFPFLWETRSVEPRLCDA